MDDPLASGPRPRDSRHGNGGNGGNGTGLPASRCDQTALDIEEIKRGTSILDVLDRYRIAVEGSGLSRRARCPFHDDRVPSFRVYLNTNRYYCFGCGAKGDVIELVQRLEGVSFREALQRLATISPSPPSAAADPIAAQSTRPAGHRVAVEPAEQDQTLRWEHAPQSLPTGATVTDRNVETTSRDEGLAAALLAAASALYQASLLHTPHALAYLLARGITRATAIEARLGFADGTSLRRFIGHDPALVRCATQMGLLDGWGRERLRERLVMPVFRGGRCIWMIGRQVGDDVEQEVAHGEGPPVRPLAPAPASGERAEAAHEPARRARSPRYLGLTLPKPLFDLDLVPDDTRQPGALRGVLVVEGIFDVLTARAWRLPIACVALVGTHLRRDQVKDLLTLAHGGPIWLGLDADEAGEKAAERLKDQLVIAGCPADAVRRLRPPGGAKDLSEVVHEAHARTAVLAVLAADSSPDGFMLGHQVSAASDAGGTRQSMWSPHVRQLAHPNGGHDDATLG